MQVKSKDWPDHIYAQAGLGLHKSDTVDSRYLDLAYLE